MMAILIGSFSCTTVASSCNVIWKPPSPTTAHTRLVGRGELRADGGRQGEAHRAQPAGGDQLPRALVDEVLRFPHLMLAHIGDDDASRPWCCATAGA